MKRAVVLVGVVAAAAISISACTTLAVVPMPDGQIEGIPYALPQKTFVVSAQYELRDCIVEAGSAKLNVKTTVNVVPVVEMDPSARYYIPYSSLHSAFKDIDLTVESYDNGTLKGLALTQTDKTGETITAALGTVVRVASIGASVALLGASKEEKPLCAAGALKALADARELEAKIAALSKKDDAKAEKPDSPASAASGAGSSTTKKATPTTAAKTPTPAAPPASAASASASAPAPTPDRVLEDLTAKLQRVKSSTLIYKEVLYWTPGRPASGSTKRFEMLVYPAMFAIQPTWLTPAGFSSIDTAELDVDGPTTRIKSLMTHLVIDTSFPVTAASGRASAPEGLILRQPVRALLRTCEVRCPQGLGGDVRAVLKADDVDIPQLGQTIVMPLRNGLFQSKTLTFAFTEDGSITKAGVKSNATAPAALSSLNSDLDIVLKAKTAKDKAKADAREAATNENKDKANQVAADNKAVVDCLTAQKALAALGGTVTGTCQ